jgi:hypothetical protein
MVIIDVRKIPTRPSWFRHHSLAINISCYTPTISYIELYASELYSCILSEE